MSYIVGLLWWIQYVLTWIGRFLHWSDLLYPNGPNDESNQPPTIHKHRLAIAKYFYVQTSGRRSYFCRIFNQGSQALSPLGLHRVAPNTSLPKPSWAVRPFQRGNRQCLAAAMVKTWEQKKQVWVHHHGHYYRETSPLLSVKVYDDFPFWSP